MKVVIFFFGYHRCVFVLSHAKLFLLLPFPFKSEQTSENRTIEWMWYIFGYIYYTLDAWKNNLTKVLFHGTEWDKGTLTKPKVLVKILRKVGRTINLIVPIYSFRIKLQFCPNIITIIIKTCSMAYKLIGKTRWHIPQLIQLG